MNSAARYGENSGDSAHAELQFGASSHYQISQQVFCFQKSWCNIFDLIYNLSKPDRRLVVPETFVTLMFPLFLPSSFELPAAASRPIFRASITFSLLLLGQPQNSG